MVSQLREDLANITDSDQGVKGMKRKLLAGVADRMGSFEEEEIYSLSAATDPRSVGYSWLLAIFKFLSGAG